MLDRDNIFFTTPCSDLITEEFREIINETLENSIEENVEHEVYLIQPSLNAPVVFVKNRESGAVKIFQIISK